MAFCTTETFRNLFVCLLFVVGRHFCSEPSQISRDTFAGLRGIEKSYGCFGVDGLKATVNELKCNEGERVCIMDVVYGVKGSQNISCPHAVAYEIPSQCCTPEPYDCIMQANARKKNDLVLECNYLSLTNCVLRVDRLDIRDVCVVTNGITTSSFRAIKYACAPNSLVKPGKNPCSALPPLDDPIWASIEAEAGGKGKEKSLKQGAATLIIASIIGFSTFFVVFILLMIFGINCSTWMVDPDDLKKEVDSTDGLDDISLRSAELGRTILNENYNIYITIPNHPRRPDKSIFSSNNAAKHNKRFYYTRVLSMPIEDVTLNAIRNVNNRFPLLNIPGEMEIKAESYDESTSPPPSYQSRVDTPVSMDSSPSSAYGLIPKRKRASSVEQRYQMLVRGPLLGESNTFFGDYFAPRRIIPSLKKPE